MKLDSNQLTGKVAIITGCNRGIGNAILDLFIENGAIIFAVARKAESLQKYNNIEQVIPCYLDVTDKNAVRNLFLTIKKQFGKLDILVNNAGVMQDALLGMITDTQVHTTFDVNVFASITMMQYASKLMVKQQSGSIINLSSIMGLYGNAGQIVYSASKGAVIAMTKSAAKELASQHIRVNAIAPGIIATDMLFSVSPEKLDLLKSKVAMGNLGSTNNVANAVLFLASDLSEYISGQILGVDGMMSN
jgi:3-oxoacyl-[acyl-carrier protein] reductase